MNVRVVVVSHCMFPLKNTIGFSNEESKYRKEIVYYNAKRSDSYSLLGLLVQNCPLFNFGLHKNFARTPGF